MNAAVVDYGEDALPALGDNVLASITALSREAREAAQVVQEAEEALRAAQSAYKDIVQRQLPELMKEAGQLRLKTLDGVQLTLEEQVRASLPKDRMIEALAWLRSNGHGAVIKNVVSASFGKGEEAQAEKAAAVLQRNNFHPERRETVHPQTLAALVREMLADGTDVPLDLLGVHLQTEVKMK